MPTAGILEGSSVLGLTESEYNALSPADRSAHLTQAAQTYKTAGADHIIEDIRGLLDLL